MKSLKILYRSQPRLIKEILLETAIANDDYRAEQLLKSGAVAVNRISAHQGMTVSLVMGEAVALNVYDETYSLTPVTQEELLDTGSETRWSDENINTSWQNK